MLWPPGPVEEGARHWGWSQGRSVRAELGRTEAPGGEGGRGAPRREASEERAQLGEEPQREAGRGLPVSPPQGSSFDYGELRLGEGASGPGPPACEPRGRAAPALGDPELSARPLCPLCTQQASVPQGQSVRGGGSLQREARPWREAPPELGAQVSEASIPTVGSAHRGPPKGLLHGGPESETQCPGRSLPHAAGLGPRVPEPHVCKRNQWA